MNQKTVQFGIVILFAILCSCGGPETPYTENLSTWADGSPKETVTYQAIYDDSARITFVKYDINGHRELSVDKLILGDPPRLDNPEAEIILDGDSIAYREEGNLKEKHQFRKGLLHGKKVLYNDDESVSVETEYAYGKRHGKMTYYYPNGQLKHLFSHENGKSIGLVESYYQNGQLSRRYYETEDGGRDSAQYFTEKGTRDFFTEFTRAGIRDLYPPIDRDINTRIFDGLFEYEYANLSYDLVKALNLNWEFLPPRNVYSKLEDRPNVRISEWKNPKTGEFLSYINYYPNGGNPGWDMMYPVRIILSGPEIEFRNGIKIGSSRTDLLMSAALIDSNHTGIALDSIFVRLRSDLQELYPFKEKLEWAKNPDPEEFRALLNSKQLQLMEEYLAHFLTTDYLDLAVYVHPVVSAELFFDRQDRLSKVKVYNIEIFELDGERDYLKTIKPEKRN